MEVTVSEPCDVIRVIVLIIKVDFGGEEILEATSKDPHIKTSLSKMLPYPRRTLF